MGCALPRAGRRVPRARAGRAGRHSQSPPGGAAGARRAVRGRAARPRRDPAAGNDALAEPAVLRLLRQQRRRAGHPRGASRCHAQLGRVHLAHVAGIHRARGPSHSTGSPNSSVYRPGGTATSRTRLPSRRSLRSPPRGHRTAGASSFAPRRRTRRSSEQRGCSGSRRARCRWTTSSAWTQAHSTSPMRPRSSPPWGRRPRPPSIRCPLLRLRVRRRESGYTLTLRMPGRRGCVPSFAGRRQVSSARTLSS
jgi:hypothetical protein